MQVGSDPNWEIRAWRLYLLAQLERDHAGAGVGRAHIQRGRPRKAEPLPRDLARDVQLHGGALTVNGTFLTEAHLVAQIHRSGVLAKVSFWASELNEQNWGYQVPGPDS